MLSPYGLCKCGCGQPTEIAKINRSARGWIKGFPKQYIKGHHMRKTQEEVTCQTCGKTFEVKPSLASKMKFCSRECVKFPNRKKKRKYGDLVTWDGYLAIYLPEHPKANISGIIMLHNYIMEQHLEKPIPEGFVVHHIDGDKQNNYISNLVLVTPSVHGKIHSTDKRKGLAKYHELRRNDS
jgi:hypothetical protein